MQDTISYTVHSFLLTQRGEQEYDWHSFFLLVCHVHMTWSFNVTFWSNLTDNKETTFSDRGPIYSSIIYAKLLDTGTAFVWETKYIGIFYAKKTGSNKGHGIHLRLWLLILKIILSVMKSMQNPCEYKEQFINNGSIFKRFDLACI